MMCYTDAFQTRSREIASFWVPRMVIRLSKGDWQHHKFETGGAAPMRTCAAEAGGTPNSPTPHQRTRCT